MELVITPKGELHCIYEEAINLQRFGTISIRRASHVEPTAEGQWLADLSPVAGPALGPFANRSQALTAERNWLQTHWLLNRRQHRIAEPASTSP
jgi:hypothetical protein